MRRRTQVQYVWSGTSWLTKAFVQYVYDGEVPLQERDGINVPQFTYTRLGYTLLARSQNAWLDQAAIAHAYYHLDGNGNITAIVNGEQSAAARYLYDPSGSSVSSSGTMAISNPYRFAGSEIDSNSGLFYCSRRFYDPSLQRWIIEFPLSRVRMKRDHEPHRCSLAVPLSLRERGRGEGLTGRDLIEH
jgi:RHS repeat-associated protein